MLKKFWLICFLIIIYNIIVFAQNNKDILDNHIIFKIKPEYKNYCFNDGVTHPVIVDILNEAGVVECKRKFPFVKPPEAEYNRYGQKLIDLTLIYEAKFTKKIPLSKLIMQLESTNIVEYASPWVLTKGLYTPNDPGVSSQYHLNIIKAFQAWDLSQGDTTVVIGIVDSGTDFSHPDLVGNVKYNYDDLPDGIDNDNDGYIDNFKGWDLGNNDNDPQVDAEAHGIHVCGIASAKTDNTIGIAGIGFKCKFLPVKIADSENNYLRAYEGIVYAAEHGCNIINCSWGSNISSGQYGQDIINYAVINKNALIIAACGNDNNEIPFYPASYDNVISVAATDQNDIKHSTSSYGIYVDLCAPGKNIFSTWGNGSYISSSGTSMAAPIVAGAAAIVKSVFPNYNALQIGEQLRATADIIDTISMNNLFQYKLGSGRINLLNAITQETPSVRISNISMTDNNDNIFSGGDTVIVTTSFTNYLKEVTNLWATISSTSPYVNIIQSNAYIGTLPTMSIINNLSNPFKIIILPNIPLNTQDIEIKIQYTGDSYSSFEFFTIKLNKNYVDIDTGLMSTSITGRGKIGFNDYFGREGLGIRHRKGKNLMFCGGIMLGNSSVQVSDNIYGATGEYDEDFTAITNIVNSKNIVNGAISYHNIFTDANSGATAMNVETEQKITTYTNIDSSKFVILEYNIKNKSQVDLQHFYAGLFIDWDINKYWSNKTLWEANLNLSYTFSTNGGPYTGIMLIYPLDAKTYAFDNDGSSGSINIYDGFSTAEKYTALSTNRYSAGQSIEGNDVASIVSAGPLNLKGGDSVKVVFAILTGDNLYDLEQSALIAKDKYYNLSGVFNENNNIATVLDACIYPNPTVNSFKISLYLPAITPVVVNIYDIAGQLKSTIFNDYLQAGFNQIDINQQLEAGIYFCQIKTFNTIKNLKLIITK
ncbi:MAG TPA: S8 family serine peptidase [Bacteroidales bacterium]|nr:S8 family serine peptidase [Bacteroidales bacterium]